MKTIKFFIIVFVASIFTTVNAQEEGKSIEKETKMSYYEQRALEDAKFEQEFKSENKKDEERFWKDQKSYEDKLKKRDRKAYKAYMKGKRDAYAEHYNHCDHSCYHSDHYYHHASFYYHRYYYEPYPRRTTMRTNIRVGVPSVRIGF
ncbi:hypothetical protein ACFO5O_01845 [Geojedonia litorea]|uniref:Uncharacterized protein n=1 Tax=Geojedonia litorea TaxID=1268269 RepID=A0ABV9N0V8_9FLAO